MKVAREIFIVILLIAVVIFTLGLMFYSSIPTNKVTPASIEYSSDGDTTATKQKIEETKLTEFEKQLLADTSADTQQEEREVILSSYTVGVGELSTARSKRLYQSGKSNPFEEYKEEPKEGDGSSDGSTGSSSSGDSSTSGSSSGKLFENTKSK